MRSIFTPENSALLLIDHQVGTMQLIRNIEMKRAKRVALALAKAARILGLPTIPTSGQDAHRGDYGVEPICKVLPIAPSTVRRHAAHGTRGLSGQTDGAGTARCRSEGRYPEARRRYPVGTK